MIYDHGNYATKLRKKLDQAGELAARRINKILADILIELNRSDPGWVLKPGENSQIVRFENGAECIVLDVETGELKAERISNAVGKEGLEILTDQLRKKAPGMSRIVNDFEKKRVVLLEKARKI